MRQFHRSLVGALAAGAIILGLAACSSSSGGSGDTSTAPPKPAAEIDALTGKSTAVALDPGFLSALTTLGLTPATIGSATLANGSLSFPITGGNVTYFTPGTVKPYVQGTIFHDGSGLSLSAGSTTVALTNFVIDPGSSKLYGDVAVNGAAAASDAYLFNLDGGPLKPLTKNADGTAVLTGTKVEVSPDAASLLDKTFNTTAVTGGLLVGIATITVNT
jgi:hypothetical protein